MASTPVVVVQVTFKVDTIGRGTTWDRNIGLVTRNRGGESSFRDISKCSGRAWNDDIVKSPSLMSTVVTMVVTVEHLSNSEYLQVYRGMVISGVRSTRRME